MKRKLFYVIALLCMATSLNAQTLTWKNYRLRLHQLTADTIAVTDAYVQYLTVDTVIVQKYYYQQEIGIVDSSTYWVSSTNDTLKLSMDQLELYAIELEDDDARVFSLDTLGYVYAKRIGINVDPTKRLSISDGTDTFHQDVASDKWTLYNDAGTPAALMTGDSLGRFAITSANATGTTTSSALSLSANSLTTGTGFYAASSSLTSGKLANLLVSGTAAASNTQTVLNIGTSGANATSTQTTYGLYSTNTHTGTASTNVGGYFSASGGTNNYGLIVANGSVGIGTTAPGSALEISKTNAVMQLTSGSTNYGYYRLLNGSTSAAFGIEGNAGGNLAPGTSAYSTVLTAGSVGKIHLADGVAPRLTINAGNVGIGTIVPLHILSGKSLSTTNNNAFNFYNGNINKNVSTVAQATDTSSYSLNWSTTGSPKLSLKGKTANSMLYVDSVGVGIGTAAPGAKLDIRSSEGGSDTLGTGQLVLGLNNPYWTFRQSATALSDLAIDRLYAGTNYEVMRIQRSTGNVGIGTTVPQAQLSQVSATPGWYMTDSDLNILRTSLAQATDTAAVYIEAADTPSLTFAGTDGDVWSLTINTSDQAVFSGASGVSFGTDALLMSTNTANYILRSDGTDYSPVKFDDSADLAGFLDDETGTGLAVFGTAPTFASTITIGTNTGTSGQINFIASDNDQANIAINTSDQVVLTGADLVIATGEKFLTGTTQWTMTATDSIDGEVIGANTIDDDALDFADITLADFTDDLNFVLASDSTGHSADNYASRSALTDSLVNIFTEVKTITGNWVNTTSPWAENELVSTVIVESDINGTGELAAIVDYETGSGALVFGTSPTFTTQITTPIITNTTTITMDAIGDSGAAYVEIIDDQNLGFLALGRTTATTGPGSRLSIVDAGHDNTPGQLVLYEDDGNGSFLWVNTASVFRGLNTVFTDDDADGYAIINLSNGTIGAPAQQGTFDDVTLADDLLLADGAVIGITGNEVITFNAAGSINITGATFDVDGAATATSFTADANIAGATYGSDASISDAELLTLDNGATTEILVGGGAGAAPVWTTATGTGAPARAGSPTFTTQITAPLGIFTTSGIQLPNTATAPGPLTGQMYYQGLNNADADTLFVYNGTAWKVFISQ